MDILRVFQGVLLWCSMGLPSVFQGGSVLGGLPISTFPVELFFLIAHYRAGLKIDVGWSAIHCGFQFKTGKACDTKQPKLFCIILRLYN